MRRIALLVSLAAALISPRLVNGQNKLRILDRPTVTVESSCNLEGKGTVPLTLRNDTTAAVAIHLSAGELTGKPPAKQLVIPSLVPKDGNLDFKTGTPPPNELAVQFTVTGLNEDGDWQSTIQNDGVDVGTVRIIRNTPPFNLTLDVPAPDAPELTFVKGKPASFRLKNGDSQEYSITWEYSVNGKVIRSSDPARARSNNSGWFRRMFCRVKDCNATAANAAPPSPDTSLTIPAGGQREISFSPPRKWFGSPFVGLFKDDTADARLTVSLIAPQCPTHPPVSKTFKVKTHLATSVGGAREGYADAIVFFLLALGGGFSLILNAFLPNEMRRLKAKKQLADLGAQISNLSYDLASRLRVLVGLEQRLIGDRLRNLSWNDNEFPAQMQSIEQAMTRLGTRLQFLEGLGTARTNFTRLRSEVLPPSIIFALELTFTKILEIGEKSDPTDDEVQKAQALIKTIQDQLDTGIQGNTDFAKSRATEVTRLQTEFAPTSGRIGKTETCKRIRLSFPGPFSRLDSIDATAVTGTPPLSADDLIDLDTTVFDVGMIRSYVDLVEGLAAADALRKKIIDHEEELLNYLKRRNPEAMYAARLLFRQMEDGWFKDDIEASVKAGSVRIKTDHGDIHPYDPCEFRLIFLDLTLNTAYARQEWTCHWAFTIGAQTLVEEGWVVTHYFQQAEPYQLKVTLSHNASSTQIDVPNVESFRDGLIPVVPDSRREISKAMSALLHGKLSEARKEWKNKHRTGRGSKTLEDVRLAMTLVIALFGLLAGAKEQLLKLDVLPALLAVFMVGFGADQIKNLLTQKPPGSDTTATPH
jgi:hypothetical protein